MKYNYYIKLFLISSNIILLSFLSANAQYYTNQNKIWVFGNHAGLSFTSGSPIPFTSSIDALEGTASVSSSTGSLLFYTDGRNVYNSTGALMPHGDTIVSFNTYSTSQAALIVPVPGSTSRYYIFSLEECLPLPSVGSAHLAYSIVDMLLDGGKGDLVAGSIGIPLADSLGEKLIPISGDSCNIWVVAHHRDSALFVAFKLSSAGIAPPVFSSTGIRSGHMAHAMGVMKASPDRSKIVSVNAQGISHGGIELFDFNSGTGIVSNCRLLDSTSEYYGAEFSPNSTKLYVCNHYDFSIEQYNIGFSSTSDIIASKTRIGSFVYDYFSDLKLAPDNKIYFGTSINNNEHLSCIPNPNNVGVSCGYIKDAVALSSGTKILLGLPNLVVSPCLTAEIPSLSPFTKNDELTIFPSPNTGVFTINVFSEQDEKVQVALTNIVGTKLKEFSILSNRDHIVHFDLDAGLYLLQAKTSKQTYVGKVIIQ